jgi:hypothetical protein
MIRSVIVAIGSALILSLLGVYFYLSWLDRKRSFRSIEDKPAYLATDEESLRDLADARRDPTNRQYMEQMAEQVKRGRLLEIPDETIARSLEAKMYKDGHIVPPYARTDSEIQSHAVFPVERVRISGGKYGGREGWVDSWYLWRFLAWP